MKKLLVIATTFLMGFHTSEAQVLSDKDKQYTEADTLRGSLRPERNYDVRKYHLTLKIEPDKKYISGSNLISFKVEENLPKMQVDLFDNMKIDSIIYNNEVLQYERRHNAVFIDFEEPLLKNIEDSLRFYYSGYPVVAENAPWDGGFVWEKDKEGNHWVGVAVQGTGASLWYPNKDHQSDEPEEVQLDIAVPDGLMNVSNGQFLGEKDLDDGFTQWSWKTINPINNYNVTINIANYEHFSDSFHDLDLNYYVLPYNLEKAKEHFEEVKLMMECFYKRFGEYPFIKDGFKLVETPYLGMEHQSAVAYGNKYKMGYLGNDISGTGIGLRFDYIIIHEAGHEWFGNSITTRDIADLWLHEGFTAYSEAVYIECRWGKEDALEYLKGLRRGISNELPLIGDYDVNAEGSRDMYSKGANLINNIRSIYNDDELWWKTLKDYSETYEHEIINSKIAESFFTRATNFDLEPVFDQYLRHPKLPELQFKKNRNEVSYRWQADVEDFSMPVDVFVNKEEIRLHPTKKWQKIPQNVQNKEDIAVNDLKFYISSCFIE